jgi:hypothetical protein
MIIFNALGNFSGLSLNKISNYLENSIGNESSTTSSQNLELVQFSLTNFRRKCKIIPQMFLKLNLGFSLGTFIMVILATIYFSNILEEEAKQFAISSFFPVIPGIMLLNLAVFIFPQYSLHRHLGRIKNSFLDYISSYMDIKSAQYLNITLIDNLEEKEESFLLLNELRKINRIIEEIEDFFTWPFNYNQVATLLVGLIFPFAPLIIELFIL